MLGIKFTSHKHYLFDHLFSKNAKKAHIDQSTLHVFWLCPKWNNSQTFKRSSCEKLFSRVYVMDTTCFDECFLFQVTTGRHYVFHWYIWEQFSSCCECEWAPGMKKSDNTPVSKKVINLLQIQLFLKS